MRPMTMPLLLGLLGCDLAPNDDTPAPTTTTSTQTATGDTGNTTDATTGQTELFNLFFEEHVYFGAKNQRQVDVTVQLPDDINAYNNVKGIFRLSCPNGLCDHWDRYGTFGIVLDASGDSPTYLELDRFITPYRTGFSWEADLTDVMPLLLGEPTFRVFIDTWVGPGHEAGDGWLFDARLVYQRGAPPSPRAVEVIPLWPHQSWNAGRPDSPVEDQVPAQTVEAVDGSTYTLRSFISGHGWNNPENCAEFCPKEHRYHVGESTVARTVWRDDCTETITDGPQYGTWEYSRAGWCPGAQVFPWDTDVTEMVEAGAPTDFAYSLEDFTWSGSGDAPYYYMSGALIRYE